MCVWNMDPCCNKGLRSGILISIYDLRLTILRTSVQRVSDVCVALSSVGLWDHCLVESRSSQSWLLHVLAGLP
eukprot:SAG31_NODE_5_length_43735_cov_42.922266_40_plen_73_part_00